MSDQIEIRDSLQHVRLRPKMYVGSLDSDGVFALFKEVLDNSVDEALEGHCTEIKVTLGDDDLITVADNGRGIPIAIHKPLNQSILEVIFTKIGACGCGCNEPAGHRAKRVGLGLAVVSALCRIVEVETTREDEIGWLNTYQAVFSQGQIATPLIEVDPTFQQGTEITFAPDSEIFEDTYLDESRVEAYIDKLREKHKMSLAVELEY